MYCIVDIETSGGQFGEEKIIEIAIYKYDGKQVLDQFSTLVNPEKAIDEFVQKLTGITDKMVKRAPKFAEVAKRIVEITKDTTLVAHNAEFDYRMLRQEFRDLGYPYQSDTLDTISLSKHLLPEQETYGLKKLTKALGIPHLDIHRAHGDARATLELFKILLVKDAQKSIIEKSINNKLYSKYTPRVLAILEELPHETGIYYIHNIHGKIIFIGAAKDIYNQLHHTFMHTSFLARKIQNKTEKISYELTGSLLIARLKYLQENHLLKAKLNKYEKRKKVGKERHDYPESEMLFFDKGRNAGEQSFFYVQNNKCVGYGYFDLQNQIDTDEKIRNRMTPIKETPLMRRFLIDFIKSQPKHSSENDIKKDLGKS